MGVAASMGPGGTGGGTMGVAASMGPGGTGGGTMGVAASMGPGGTGGGTMGVAKAAYEAEAKRTRAANPRTFSEVEIIGIKLLEVKLGTERVTQKRCCEYHKSNNFCILWVVTCMRWGCWHVGNSRFDPGTERVTAAAGGGSTGIAVDALVIEEYRGCSI